MEKTYTIYYKAESGTIGTKDYELNWIKSDEGFKILYLVGSSSSDSKTVDLTIPFTILDTLPKGAFNPLNEDLLKITEKNGDASSSLARFDLHGIRSNKAEAVAGKVLELLEGKLKGRK
ncbi:hypothetical protein [Adhaeribacter soli]|uniref:Uncharacterized protein n=1 Tax=Adhaeribacter soli TaxID=2607655 RepID=A0A5N1INJ3_9BACT|nr:hypothetical protein [Adhaeribacter soli]KAA9325050.1 hypothetical protein F0P94_19285 [Adhaeribacter soli]